MDGWICPHGNSIVGPSISLKFCSHCFNLYNLLWCSVQPFVGFLPVRRTICAYTQVSEVEADIHRLWMWSHPCERTNRANLLIFTPCWETTHMILVKIDEFNRKWICTRGKVKRDHFHISLSGQHVWESFCCKSFPLHCNTMKIWWCFSQAVIAKMIWIHESKWKQIPWHFSFSLTCVCHVEGEAFQLTS